MKICVLANGYPTKKTAAAVFVAKLCDELADLGNDVVIIAPQSLSRAFIRDTGMSSTRFTHKTKRGNLVEVLRPYTVSFSNGKLSSKLNYELRKWAVKRVLSKIGKPDVYYGHFWNNAFLLFDLVASSGIPLFVATGESVITFRTKNERFKQYVSGVIGVSTKNIEESISRGLTVREKCIVLPNSIDDEIFRLMDKRKCRQELGIEDDKFVVAFVGNFSERKGVMRLSSAIDKCDDNNIGVVFLGRPTEMKPSCRGIIKMGYVNHDDIPKYLNAADVYVLPSLAEGCSNSIVEAMACGLPIISSDLPFNYDILDKNNAILVNPSNDDEIAKAIKLLRDNPTQRKKMAEESVIKAKSLNLTNRATQIINFIESKGINK